MVDIEVSHDDAGIFNKLINCVLGYFPDIFLKDLNKKPAGGIEMGLHLELPILYCDWYA